MQAGEIHGVGDIHALNTHFEAEYDVLVERFEGAAFLPQRRLLVMRYTTYYQETYKKIGEPPNRDGLRDRVQDLVAFHDDASFDLEVGVFNAQYRDLIINEIFCLRIMADHEDQNEDYECCRIIQQLNLNGTLNFFYIFLFVFNNRLPSEVILPEHRPQ